MTHLKISPLKISILDSYAASPLRSTISFFSAQDRRSWISNQNPYKYTSASSANSAGTLWQLHNSVPWRRKGPFWMNRHHWKTSMLLKKKKRENSCSWSETGILYIASPWAISLCIWMVPDSKHHKPQTWNVVGNSCRLASSAASTPNTRPSNMRCPELLFW